jgi:hypothetical protein
VSLWTQKQTPVILAASGSNPYTLAYGSNVTASSLLVATVTWATSTGSISDFGDTLNGSNVWILANISQTGSRTVATYFYNNTLGGACTVSVQLSTTETVFLSIYELAGPLAEVDTSLAGGSATATTSPTSGSITPTDASDLIIAAYRGGTVSAGESGWSKISTGGFSTQYIQPGSTAALAATWTSGSSNYAANIVAFKPVLDPGPVTSVEKTSGSASESEALDAGAITSAEKTLDTAVPSTARDTGSATSQETTLDSATPSTALDAGSVDAQETSLTTATPQSVLDAGAVQSDETSEATGIPGESLDAGTVDTQETSAATAQVGGVDDAGAVTAQETSSTSATDQAALDAGTVDSVETSEDAAAPSMAVDAGPVTAEQGSRAGAISGSGVTRDPGPVSSVEHSGATAAGQTVRDVGSVVANESTRTRGRGVPFSLKPYVPAIDPVDMSKIAKTVQSIGGDFWDTLSKRIYGSEKFCNVLMGANPALGAYVQLPANSAIRVPYITVGSNASSLPWSTLYQSA